MTGVGHDLAIAGEGPAIAQCDPADLFALISGGHSCRERGKRVKGKGSRAREQGLGIMEPWERGTRCNWGKVIQVNR